MVNKAKPNVEYGLRESDVFKLIVRPIKVAPMIINAIPAT